jgi:hypothetical protein
LAKLRRPLTARCRSRRDPAVNIERANMSREPIPTPPPRPPRTKLKPEQLDSERFLRYLLAIVVVVAVALVAVTIASLVVM